MKGIIVLGGKGGGGGMLLPVLGGRGAIIGGGFRDGLAHDTPFLLYGPDNEDEVKGGGKDVEVNGHGDGE